MNIEWFSGGGVETVVVRANRGLLVSRDGGATFRLLCRDALGISESEVAPIEFTTEGNLLISTFTEAILRSSPDYCTWSPAGAPIGGRRGTHLAASSAGPGTFYLLTGENDTTENFFVSANDGVDWAPLGATSDFFSRIAVAPSDPQRIYRSGAANSVDAGYPPIISVSTDAGGTWNAYPIPALPEELQPRLAGVHAAMPDRVFVRTVASSNGLPERLLLSTTGGPDFATVLTAPDLLAHVSSSDGTIWAGSSEGLYRSADDGDTFALVPTSGLTRITCLEWHADRLYACGIRNNTLEISVSSDHGDTFETYLRFADVRDRLDCPADSAGGATCDTQFADWYCEVVQGRSPVDCATGAVPGPDAGPAPPAPDAGAAPPGAPDASASPPAARDASSAPPDGASPNPAGSTSDSGCGCKVSRAARGEHALLLAAFAALVAARRRR